jgi:ABC-3C biological conflict system middle component
MMLTPRKHLNLDVSVLRIAAIMLRELNKRGVVGLERLRGVILRRAGADADLSFLPALSFLFLLGRIEYHVMNDTVEFKTD